MTDQLRFPAPRAPHGFNDNSGTNINVASSIKKRRRIRVRFSAQGFQSQNAFRLYEE
jgi:hypothetical protein